MHVLKVIVQCRQAASAHDDSKCHQYPAAHCDDTMVLSSLSRKETPNEMVFSKTMHVHTKLVTLQSLRLWTTRVPHITCDVLITTQMSLQSVRDLDNHFLHDATGTNTLQDVLQIHQA